MKGLPTLRSPHSVNIDHVGSLRRPRPGAWVLVLVAWFTALMNAQIVARRRGERQWANIFLWISCYLLAIVIDASFDVALEGPMLGIWFWSLFGFRASAMVYRAYLETSGVAPLLQRARVPSGSGLRSGSSGRASAGRDAHNSG